MAQKDLFEKAAGWFDDIADIAGRLTTGNVSHMAPTIKGKATRSAEFIRKHGDGSDDIELFAKWFDGLAEKATRLTTGNVSHLGATIRVTARDARFYIINELEDMRYEESKS